MGSVPTDDAVVPEPALPAAPPVAGEPETEAPAWLSDGDVHIEGLAEEIKRVAMAEQGVREPQAYERYCHSVGVPGSPAWCVYFMAWCWRKATGQSHPHAPWENYGYQGFGHTYEVYTWARSRGKLEGHPASGMLYGIEDGYEHTGLLIGVNPSTLELWTINGNWGDAVAYQTWTHIGGRAWQYGTHRHTLFFASW